MANKFFIYDKETGIVAMICDDVGNSFDQDKFGIFEGDESIIEEASESGMPLKYDSETNTILVCE